MVKKEEVQKLVMGILAALFFSLGISYVTTMKFKQAKDINIPNVSEATSDSSEKVEGPSEKEFMEMLKNLRAEADKSVIIPGLELENRKEDIKEEKQEEKVEVAHSTVPSEEKDAQGNLISRTEYPDEETEKVTHYKDGQVISVETRTYDPKLGKANGKADIEFTNGMKQTLQYVNGVKDGVTYIEYTNGDQEMTYYTNDILDGESKYTFANGEQEFFTYVKGVPHGEAVYVYKDGREEKYRYENGNRVN